MTFFSVIVAKIYEIDLQSSLHTTAGKYFIFNYAPTWGAIIFNTIMIINMKKCNEICNIYIKITLVRVHYS